MKIGVMGNPGGWSTERLADAIEKRTGARFVIDPEELRLDSRTGRVSAGKVVIDDLDALVIKKTGRTYGPEHLDRLALLRHAGAGGVRFFSNPDAIASLLSRISCTQALLEGGIPMPPTVITGCEAQAVSAIEEMGLRS